MATCSIATTIVASILSDPNDAAARLPKSRGIVRSSSSVAVGNVVYGVSQASFIVVLARVSNPETVGALTLALAVATPIYLLADSNLRIAVSTDPDYRVAKGVFQATRRRTIVLAAGICSAAAIALPDLRMDLGLFFAVIAYRSADSFSNLSYGFGFRSGLGDLVGRFAIARGVLSIAIGAPLLVLIPSQPAIALAGISAAWLAVATIEWRQFGLGSPFRSSDSVRWDESIALMRSKAFLGVDAFVSSFTYNVPRYAVQAIKGPAELGVFGALGMIANGFEIVVGAAANIMLPGLARSANQRDVSAFKGQLRALTVFGATCGAIAILLAWTVGSQVAGFVLGEEYGRTDLIVALTAATVLRTLAQLVGKGLQATQAFGKFLIADLVALVVAAACTIPFVSAWDTAGGGWAIAAGAGAGLVVSFMFVGSALGRLR